MGRGTCASGLLTALLLRHCPPPAPPAPHRAVRSATRSSAPVSSRAELSAGDVEGRREGGRARGEAGGCACTAAPSSRLQGPQEDMRVCVWGGGGGMSAGHACASGTPRLWPAPLHGHVSLLPPSSSSPPLPLHLFFAPPAHATLPHATRTRTLDPSALHCHVINHQPHVIKHRPAAEGPTRGRQSHELRVHGQARAGRQRVAHGVQGAEAARGRAEGGRKLGRRRGGWTRRWGVGGCVDARRLGPPRGVRSSCDYGKGKLLGQGSRGRRRAGRAVAHR
jgi:hypothetical protein